MVNLCIDQSTYDGKLFRVRVYDQLGRLRLARSGYVDAGEVPVALGDLPAGLYEFRVTVGNEGWYLKLLRR